MGVTLTPGARFTRNEQTSVSASGGDSAAGRGAQWADTFRAVRDFPILGSGLGTYAFHCPFYKTLRTQAVFDHAHNDYLELLSEVGIVGLGLCAWGIIRFASTTASVSAAGQRRPALVVWTPAAGVAGVLLHRLAALTPWFAQLPLRGPQPESADPIKLLASNADTAARERHDDWPC